MTNRNYAVTSLLALSLFTISTLTTSCIDENKSLGEDVIPGDQNLAIKSVTVDIPVQMKIADSLQTIYPDYLLVGAYKDPDLGTTLSGGAFHMIPVLTENDYGDNPVPYYLKMYITVTQNLVLNDNEGSIPQNIYIYKLNKDIDSTTLYSNSLSLADIDQVPLNLGSTTYYGGDSINMQLSLDYARELLSSTQEERDSAEIFVKRFKGLFISAEPLPGSLTGGRFNVIDPGDIYLELKYRHVEVDSLIDKDSVILFYAPTSIPYMNKYEHSSSNLESSQPQGKIMLEGLAGIKPYIDFEDVKREFSQWAESENISLDRIIISKAELRLPYEFPADYKIMGQFPSQIFLSNRLASETYNDLPLYFPVSDINILSTGGINRSQFYYSLNISSYLQKVFNGKKSGEELKTWIAPITQYSNSYTGEVTYYVDNMIYCKATLNGQNDIRKPHIVMTYTVLP
jgi:hypothetical protein